MALKEIELLNRSININDYDYMTKEERNEILYAMGQIDFSIKRGIFNNTDIYYNQINKILAKIDERKHTN